MPRDVSLSDSKCWNGGQKWVKFICGFIAEVCIAATNQFQEGVCDFYFGAKPLGSLCENPHDEITGKNCQEEVCDFYFSAKLKSQAKIIKR